MWRILQHDNPKDFVFATSKTHTVEELCLAAFAHAEMPIEFTGEGIERVGRDAQGSTRVSVNPDYYRPTEVDLLLGDPPHTGQRPSRRYRARRLAKEPGGASAWGEGVSEMSTATDSNPLAAPGAQVTIVVPVYNEEGNISALTGQLRSILNEGRERYGDYELIFVDDGSTDETWARVVAEAHADPRIRGLSLSRNFGHQHALFAGLCHASGQAIITMDGDLQHPPDKIPELLEAWKAGFKIVNTRRKDRGTTGLFKRLSSRLFYKAFSALSDVEMSSGASDFRLVDRQILEVFQQVRDAHLFLRGVAQWVGFPAKTVEYVSGERLSGKTKYSVSKMIRFATTAIVSFSTRPLLIGVWIGLLTSVLAFAELAYILVQYSRGITVPGWASALGITALLFGLLFLVLGIVGIYLARIHQALQDRPRFIIGGQVNLPEPTEGARLERGSGRASGR